MSATAAYPAGKALSNHQLPKHCIGWAIDGNGVLVRCPEPLPPDRPKYHSTECFRQTDKWQVRKGLQLGGKVQEPRACVGWTLQDGVIVKCGKLFTPDHENQIYHSTECLNWTWQRRHRGLDLGDAYVRGARKQKQYRPKRCKEGWTIRDGVIARCNELFTPTTSSQKYHSGACFFRTRDLKERGFKFGESVRRTCGYRNCTEGEGGTRKTFDRARRSPTGGYYCCDLHSIHERLARVNDDKHPKVSADELARFRADPSLQSRLDLPFVVCLECGRKFSILTGALRAGHLYRIHKMTGEDYLTKWPDAPTVSSDYRKATAPSWTRERRQRYSARRKRFWDEQKLKLADAEAAVEAAKAKLAEAEAEAERLRNQPLPEASKPKAPPGQVGATSKRTPADLEDAIRLYGELGSWGKVAKKKSYSEWKADQKGTADRLRLQVEYYIEHRLPLQVKDYLKRRKGAA